MSPDFFEAAAEAARGRPTFSQIPPKIASRDSVLLPSSMAMQMDPISLSRPQFCNGVEFAGLQFLEHHPAFHPSKNKPCLKDTVARIDAMTPKEFAPHLASTNALLLKLTKSGAFTQFSSTKSAGIVREAWNRVILQLQGEHQLGSFIRGLLSLAVAREGDRIRHMVWTFGPSDPADYEPGGVAVSSMGDPQLQPLFFRAAHSLVRSFGPQVDVRSSQGADMFAAINSWTFLLFKQIADDAAPGTSTASSAKHVHKVDPISGQCGCSSGGSQFQRSEINHPGIAGQAAESHALKQKTACSQCDMIPGPNDAGLKACGRCLIARYCSSECQKAAWKSGHKQACQPANSA